MKKIFSVFLISLIVLTSCNQREKEIIEAPKVLSREEIIEQNSSITDGDIELVQFIKPVNGDTVMTLVTTAGDIHFVLYPQYASVAVNALVENVNAGAYRNVTINQIVNNFYFNIAGNQALAPDHQGYLSAQTSTQVVEESAKTKDSLKVPTMAVGVESSLDLWHFKGALAMRDNLKNTPESSLTDIFVVGAFSLNEEIVAEMEKIGYPKKVLNKYKEVGGIPGYDTNYTIIGQVYYGMDIVDKISATRVIEDFAPQTPINVIDIYITAYDASNPPEKVKEILTEGEESTVISGEEAEEDSSAETPQT